MPLVNISIDDISPHPDSSTEVLDRCMELIELFPAIKFTLFIPIAYWRVVTGPTEQPLYINKFPNFCNELKSLAPYNFELGYHGYYHGIPEVPTDNDEFCYSQYPSIENVSKDFFLEKFRKMFTVVSKSPLDGVFKKIFRPPAFRMQEESLEAAKEAGIEILALLDGKDQNIYLNGAHKSFPKVSYANVIPTDGPATLSLYPKTEIVYHACRWDSNYLSLKKTEQLAKFLHSHDDTIKFTFMEGVV